MAQEHTFDALLFLQSREVCSGDNCRSKETIMFARRWANVVIQYVVRR
jgi:hypothetical protein